MERVWAVVILGKRPAETLLPGPWSQDLPRTLTGACRPSGAGFPGMCLPPRQLAEALLFLRKAPAVKNVVKLHLQAPAWAWLRLGKNALYL